MYCRVWQKIKNLKKNSCIYRSRDSASKMQVRGETFEGESLMVSKFVFPPNSYVEIPLLPKMMGREIGVFGKGLKS